MKIEFRTIAAQPVKIEGRKLSGIAIPYNQNSLDLGGFVERFLPGSVSDTIKSGRIEVWAHHDRTKPVGSQASGSLRLWEENNGLHYENEMPEGNTDAENVASLLSNTRGGKPIIGGTSFGFAIAGTDGQRWTQEGKQYVREVVRADLEHISPVVTPAYPQTTAILRSLQGDGIQSAEDLYGIDLAAVAKLFLAIRRGFPVEQNEIEEARKAITLLQSATVLTPRLTLAEDQAARMLM